MNGRFVVNCTLLVVLVVMLCIAVDTCRLASAWKQAAEQRGMP